MILGEEAFSSPSILNRGVLPPALREEV
jgi:hypothetical protein